MTTSNIAIYTSFTQVENFWNASLPQNHNLQLSQLKVVELAKIDNITPYYIVVHQNNKIVLQLYVQTLRCTSTYINNEHNNCLLNSISKVALQCINIKLLVIGHLFRHDGSYIYFDNDVKDKQKLLLDTLDFIQKKIYHQAVFLKDLPEYLSLPFKTNNRFQSFNNDISMQMSIPATWQNMDDYHNLLTKKYAKRFRTTQKQFEGVQIKELLETEVIAQQQEIFQLYKKVAKNQSVSLGLLNQNYFAEFKKSMGNELKIYGYYRNGKLIAFSSAILHNGVYDMNYIGFDYTQNAEIQLYFNMLFCCVKNAIETKSHTLILGRTALEAKAILGCKPVTINGFYKINNRLFSFLVKKIANRTANNQGDMWMQRHPFKTTTNN